MTAVVVMMALLWGFSAPAHAAKPAKPDVPNGQACADVVQGDAWYRDASWGGSNPPASPTVYFQFTLAAPSCAKSNADTTYQVQIFPVYSGVADTTPAVTNQYLGDGSTQTFFPPAGNYVLPADSRGTADHVCIVVTTAIGGKVIDVAPDAGCDVSASDSWVLLDDTGNGGSRGWY
jgi:hypothetical protein